MIKEKYQKRSFLYALIATLIIFNLGVYLGYMLEVSRINKISEIYMDSEIEVLDQIIQKDYSGVLNPTCEQLSEENIKFGDKLFEEALKIQSYEDASVINKDIIFQHKRLDLLRTLFFINSIQIKEKCNSKYNIVAYLYQYNNPTLEQSAKQKFFSNILKELKNKFGNNVLLIPIAADNDIPSVNLLVKTYNITELPVILINNKEKLTQVKNIEEIERYLN